MASRRFRSVVFSGALAAIAAGAAACGEGCKHTSGASGAGAASATVDLAAALATGTPPTLRIYLMSTVAGALEPCGCSKNQLGGFDHFAAFLAKQRRFATHDLILGAGPLFFLDPVAKEERALQDRWKADAIADALATLGLAAWSPGLNDWQAGATGLHELQLRSKATMLAANLVVAPPTSAAPSASAPTAAAAPSSTPTAIREINGVKVGLVGVSQPTRMGLAPEGVKVNPAAGALERGIADLKSRGAQVLVAIMAMPRGEALRLVESVGADLQVAVIGKPFDQGEGNDKPAPAALLGKTLVVETANHLQSVGVVDLFVRGGSFEFQDAAGIARNEDRAVLKGREEDLTSKIRRWEQDASMNPKDIAARRAELAQVQADLRKLETPPEPTQGSYFRFSMLPVHSDLGRDPAVYDAMLSFYGRVNDHNKRAFAGREPPPPGPDDNRYVGLEVCSSCHTEARKVWNNTPHASAYATLVAQHKEFNLDCVSCHVTGYEKPGGSSITKNDLLQAVQCEECHGAGALHSKTPTRDNIVARPSTDTCVSSCHHPPHVEGFDPVAQMHRILGPGHGKVEEWPPLKKR